jgi:hypothetical protein
MTPTFPPVTKVNTVVRRAVRAIIADLLAVFTLGVLFGFLWWGGGQ